MNRTRPLFGDTFWCTCIVPADVTEEVMLLDPVDQKERKKDNNNNNKGKQKSLLEPIQMNGMRLHFLSAGRQTDCIILVQNIFGTAACAPRTVTAAGFLTLRPQWLLSLIHI